MSFAISDRIEEPCPRSAGTASVVIGSFESRGGFMLLDVVSALLKGVVGVLTALLSGGA